MLAISATILGAIGLVWAVVWLGVAHESSQALLVRWARLVALVLAGLALLEFVFAYGVWTLRSWALPFGVAVLVATIALTMIGRGHGHPGAELGSLLLQIGTLIYLLSAGVRSVLAPGE